MAEDQKPHHHGHRDRLKQRFAESDGAGMPEYELLELLLFYAIPRKDVKPLAKDLIAKFGSLAEVLTADLHALAQVNGLSENSATLLKAVYAANKTLLKTKASEKPVLSSWQSLLDYCHAVMAYETKETFRILYLNQKNELIEDVLQQTGTVNHTPVYPREILHKGLELGATAMILLHNHPSGDPRPSEADITLTMEIDRLAQGLGIHLHDHVIIAKSGHSSLRNLGVLD